MYWLCAMKISAGKELIIVGYSIDTSNTGS